LLPFNYEKFTPQQLALPPLITLAPYELLTELAEEYVFAELCEAVILSFAAENAARMRTMIAAHANAEKKLAELSARARLLRQEQITSEVIELAAGVMLRKKTSRQETK
ncbi:MAG: F0F1 ATP synthase subunit gamma, partial [Alphaproteobacteria bacterium]|nr:F0F1 ATP synthase subunit gamma [Alphaproteobacteria bacterium]